MGRGWRSTAAGRRGVRAFALVATLASPAFCGLAVFAAPAGAVRTSPPLVIATVVGTGRDGASGDGGPATAADIDQPRSIALLPDGSFLFAAAFRNTVRRVWPDGHISTFAGTGVGGFSGNGGPATSAMIRLPHAVSVLADGSVLIDDDGNNDIRRVAADGTIELVAGLTPQHGFGGDGGPATKARLEAPRGAAALPGGGFLIADTGNNRIRQVAPDGTITTVAGNGVAGYAGDGGPATAAELHGPFGVSPLPGGGFLIADIANNRIRKVAPDGTITTVAGTGVQGFSGDGGPATAAALNAPSNVWPTADGGFLIADTNNNRIRRVAPDGTITTVAGNGVAGFRGDGGPPTAAELNAPKAVVVTASGALLIADSDNNRIRYVGPATRPAATARPTIAGRRPVAGVRLTGSTGTWKGIPAPTYAYHWLRCGKGGVCRAIKRATSATYVVTAADAGSRLRLRVTATNAAGSVSTSSAPTRVVGGHPAAKQSKKGRRP